MIELKTPNAPATDKQLWRLHELTGEDTREWKLTMQQASDKIAELEEDDLSVPVEQVDNGREPFSEAHICMIEGDQGSGKSNTAVGMVVDAYRKDAVQIYCRDVLKIICLFKGFDPKSRIAKIKVNGQQKLIRIPQSYKLISPIRIFSNFHLYGIPYVYCPTFSHILKWLKADIIRDGWLLIDEYYIGGNARDSMSKFGKALQKQGFQYRKMQLEVVLLTPLASLIDKYARITPTKRILCSFNKKTREITLEIREKGVKGTKTVTYPASQYWRNYWTNERINE